MSHSFWISAAVQHRLDFLNQIWLQAWSCWTCQYCKIQPSSTLSQPMWACSFLNGVDEYSGHGGCSHAHASKFCKISSHIIGSIPWTLIHILSSLTLAHHSCLAPSALQWRICSLSSFSVLHIGHFATDCCPHHCMFLLCANWLVICLVTHLYLCVGSFCTALSMALQSTSLSVSDNCVIFECQYCCAGGPFRVSCNATLGFFTCCQPVISMNHDSFGSWYSGWPLCSPSMQAFANRLASLFSRASQDNTVGCPLSWYPLMCKYITVQGRIFSIFLHAFNRLECAANRSTGFLDCRWSKTEQPLHDMLMWPVALGSVANNCCSMIRIP